MSEKQRTGGWQRGAAKFQGLRFCRHRLIAPFWPVIPTRRALSSGSGSTVHGMCLLQGTIWTRGPGRAWALDANFILAMTITCLYSDFLGWWICHSGCGQSKRLLPSCHAFIAASSCRMGTIHLIFKNTLSIRSHCIFVPSVARFSQSEVYTYVRNLSSIMLKRVFQES